jgi:hypothetical protein
VVGALQGEDEFELATVFGRANRRTLAIAFRRAISLHNQGWISLVQQKKPEEAIDPPAGPDLVPPVSSADRTARAMRPSSRRARP